MARFVMKGVREAMAAIRDRGRRVEQGARRAVYIVELNILNFSQRIVPVDKGVLRSTGDASIPTTRAGIIRGRVSYGGPAAPYAAKVHEDLHARHSDGQSAKFLELGALAEGKKLNEVMADEVRKELVG